MKLKDKIVAITGASSGIGEACAVQCARAGAKLILIARRKERLQDLADNLAKEYNTQAYIMCIDVSDNKQVEIAFADLPKEWSNIDILINNAGFALGRDRFQDARTENLASMVDTNINGVIYITKSVLPNMLARNQGHIVNIGSISGHETYAGGTTYCATKFAITGLTSGLKKDLLGTDIRVTLISPGLVKTEFSLVRFNQDKERADKVYSDTVPLMAEDIADTVLFCITRPAHVNIYEMLVLPTYQANVGMVHNTK